MVVDTTWQEYSHLCEDELACLAFNFLGPKSDFHPYSGCLLLYACESKVFCNDCVIIGVSESSNDTIVAEDLQLNNLHSVRTS